MVAQGYTGLIYSLEILTGLGALMTLTSRPSFVELLERIVNIGAEEEQAHATGSA